MPREDNMKIAPLLKVVIDIIIHSLMAKLFIIKRTLEVRYNAILLRIENYYFSPFLNCLHYFQLIMLHIVILKRS